MNRNHLLIAGLLTASFAGAVSADIHHVPGMHATIQDGINAASVGDVVVIAPGTYVETITINKDIVVRSEDRDPRTVIIDANAALFTPTVKFIAGLTSNARLIGVTVTGADSESNGGGIAILDGDVVVRRCIITGNKANLGAGIFSGSNGLGGSPEITQCLIYDNESTGAGAGLYLNFSGSPTITNCAIVDNTSTGGSTPGILVFSDAQVTVRNSIISNPGTTDELLWLNNSTMDVEYSLIDGGFTGAGNIDTDPGFVAPGGGDFRLAPGSPCIDAGDNTSLGPSFEEDMVGGLRYRHDPHTPNTGNGTAPLIDMGPLEYLPAVRYVDVDAKGTGDGLTWTDAYNDLGLAIAAFVNDDDVTEVWVADGVYHPDFGSGDRFSAFILTSGKAYYGGFTGDELFMDDRDYDTNETVLSGAIGASGDTDNSYHVVVAGDAADETSILDGFIIQKAYNEVTSDGGGIKCVDGASPRFVNCWIRLNYGLLGSGVFAEEASPTFLRCSINKNEGGEAVFARGEAPWFINCRIAGNAGFSPAGTGLHIRETTGALVANCTIYGNDNTNPASFNGGLAIFDGTATVANNLIWANTSFGSSTTTSNFYDLGTTLTMECTSVEGASIGFAGSDTNNGHQPDFVDLDGPNNVMGDADDDFSLAANSRSIDSGDISLVPAGMARDFNDNPRHVNDAGMPNFDAGSHVDRGCLEFQGVSCPYDRSPNGQVDVNDLLVVLGEWGGDGDGDVTPAGGDGVIDIFELLGILGAWGPCP